MARRTGFSGSALIRLLARLSDIDVPPPDEAFADRLGRWVGWTDAIALASALNVDAPTASPVAPHPATDDEKECSRVRTALATPLPAHAVDDDFRTCRRHYHARQHAMEAGIGPLRQRLRSRLSTRSPSMARLAAVDEALADMSADRERTLLSTVPVLLERRFERLDRESASWLIDFRQDLHGVLLAELALRFQPVDGLLAALRSR